MGFRARRVWRGVVWCVVVWTGWTGEGGGLLLTKGIVAIHYQTPPLDTMISTLYHDRDGLATNNSEFNLFFTPNVRRLGNGHHPSIFQPSSYREIYKPPPTLRPHPHMLPFTFHTFLLLTLLLAYFKASNDFTYLSLVSPV